MTTDDWIMIICGLPILIPPLLLFIVTVLDWQKESRS